MAFLVCLLFRESIGVAITKSFVIFVRKFFVSSIIKKGPHLIKKDLVTACLFWYCVRTK